MRKKTYTKKEQLKIVLHLDKQLKEMIEQEASKNYQSVSGYVSKILTELYLNKLNTN
ncbi:MAG: hypothetical protein ACP5GK_09395 [Desulfurella sp.]|jgi:predicted HicB family RNase H-like nuclease|uniref:hypothetical protein n=1 Tax=Desulfurella sp. TaxID=1962857 RepID=UPI003D0B54CA